MSLYESLMERLGGQTYSGYFSCLCPFHDDHKPSFFVYEESDNKNWEFRCASCGKHGSLVYLDKKIGSHFISFQKVNTVSNVLPRWRKWEEKFGSLEGIVEAAHKSLKRHPQFQTYFRKRKIYEFVDEGVLGYMDNWCLFPIRDRNGAFVNIVVRSISNSSDVRYVVKSSKRNNVLDDTISLYVPSWERVNSSQTIYVVYGLIDSISLHLAGLPSISGISGKSLSPELLRPLNKRFVIIPDKDEEREGVLLANKLGWRARSKNINWPDGTKDCDDIRRIYGNTALLELLS